MTGLAAALVLVALAMRQPAPQASDMTRADAATERLLVFAAASTTDVITSLAMSYESETGVQVKCLFASSSVLARQIESGAAADVFISADLPWMQHLIDGGHVQASARVNLLSNRLALVRPIGGGASVEMSPESDLAAAFEGRLAAGDPDHVPVGRYAKAALLAMGWWDGVASRLAPADNTRAALRFVESGEVELGIVYLTDAKASQKVSVVGLFPADSHPPITYPAAVVGEGTNAARGFMAYLQSPAAAAVYARAGFSLAGGGEP